MLLSITANLLHVVMLKRPLNLLMAENNSESVDVDPHSNTDTTTVTCLPVGVVAAVRAGALRVFFSGYAFGYGPKTTGATY